MATPEFSELMDKVKSGANEVAGKVKSGASIAAEKVKDAADGIVKAAQVKKPEQTEKMKPVQKEKSPKVKLDDALRMAVDQYNDACTTMNDNGATLCFLS